MTKSNRKGFTLVELLIVIVVIGVLSAMMMLSSTEAVSSARASNVISNLRNLKTAVLSWYADNLDRVATNGMVKDNPDDADSTAKPIQEKNVNGALNIAKYLNGDSITLNDKGGSEMSGGTYGVFDAGDKNRTTWFVGYKFAASETTVKEKVRSKAASLGLIFAGKSPNTTGDTVVWFRVFGDWKPTTTANN